jgi:hypothetical protein
LKKSGSIAAQSETELLEKRLAELGDWRGRTLGRVHDLIKQADPEAVEDEKWRKPTNPIGVPVWSHEGIIYTGEIYKDKVKFTFAKGSSLEDTAGLFNASLAGKARRAIDLDAGDEIDSGGFTTLIRAALARNSSGNKAKPRRAK